jgi:hypothetical protein
MNIQNNTIKFQQGDLIIKSTEIKQKDFGKKLNHLILQKSDVSNHKHQLINGDAILYEGKNKDEFYLNVKSDKIELIHEEHKSINIPKGKYYVYGVREFDPFEDEIRRIRD